MDARRNWPVIGGVAVLALAAVVLVVSGVVWLTGMSTEVEAAAETCARSGQPLVADGGETLTVTSGRTLSAEEATAVSSCVLADLGAPLSVLTKVEGTTAMMGRQSDTWDDYKATWTYHPDDGLELIIEAD